MNWLNVKMRKMTIIELDRIEQEKINDDPEYRDHKWIEAVLINDEYSTDEEMEKYFISAGLDKNLVSLILSQRDEALKDGLNFELEL
jgi:hypothetical protein